MTMKKAFPIALVLLSLAACQSVSDVIPTGQGTYLVGATVRGGLTSDVAVTALSVKRGTEFCAAMGKQFEMANATNSGMAGWTPQQSQVMFRCL
jgi:hypothetical protein